MAPYPTPTANDTGDLLQIFNFVNNEASGGLFFPLILLGIWFIAFIGAIAEGRPAARAMIFSSFICGVLAGMLVLLGYLNPTYMYFVVLLVAFGIGWAYLSQSRND